MLQQSNIEKCIKELAAREKAFEDACKADSNAEYEYKMCYAREFLSADGTVDERKQTAIVKCEKELKAHLTASATLAMVRVKVADAQDVLSARQSLLSSSVKSDLGYTRSAT